MTKKMVSFQTGEPKKKAKKRKSLDDGLAEEVGGKVIKKAKTRKSLDDGLGDEVGGKMIKKTKKRKSLDDGLGDEVAGKMIKKTKKRKSLDDGSGGEMGGKMIKKAKHKAGSTQKDKQKVQKGEGRQKAGVDKASKKTKSPDKLDVSVSEAEKKREERQKQKTLKETRQKKSKTDDVYKLGTEAKKIWEQLRREDCKPETKKKLVEDLFQAVKGKLKKIIYAHDTVRVIECLVSLSTDSIRDELYKEARDDLIGLIKSKYGHYFVEKLIKYGKKELRTEIFRCFDGKVAELMKHKIANNVVESYFNEHANAVQRNRMLQEFCGPEFRTFKEDDIRTVPALIEKYPEKKKDIVRHLGDNVSTLITKGCYNHSLVHTVIFNYLQVCSAKARSETIEQLRDVCVHVLHSHDGARMAMICFWHGTAKDRKAIIKSFKTFIKKICTEEQGYLVMLSLFDTVDDTKLVAKAVLHELSTSLDEIAANEHGRKVLMYLMVPRSTTYFHPDIIALLKQGDGNEHSKKDSDLRYSELKEAISASLCKYMLEHMPDMLSDNRATILITCVVNHADPKHGEPLLRYLAEQATMPFVKGEGDNMIENAATHLMLKKIIANDKKRDLHFSNLLLDALDNDGVESWLTCNRGAFLFVNMVETEIPEVKKKLKDKLKSFTKTLQQQKTPGAELLQKKLR